MLPEPRAWRRGAGIVIRRRFGELESLSAGARAHRLDVDQRRGNFRTAQVQKRRLPVLVKAIDGIRLGIERA